MKKVSSVLIAVGVIVALIVISAGAYISTYNTLVSKSENVESKFKQVDNQLLRRNDLIPNLVSTVKGYAAHEEKIFTALADARSKIAGATTVAGKAQGDAELTSALKSLNVIVENYPLLKANENFLSLQDELAGGSAGL